MTEPTDRAEQAFRDALTAHAEQPEFVPLDPEALAAAAAARDAEPVPVRRRQRRWVPVLVAAAAVVVVGVGSLAVLPGVLDATKGPAVVTSADRENSVAAGSPMMPASVDRAPSEFRWVTLRGARVAVPESWVDGEAPRSDWCVASTRPTRPAAPVVEVTPPEERGPVLAIACPPLPADLQVSHLTWVDATEPAERRDEVEQGWRTTTWVARGVAFTLVTPESEPSLADQIVASTR